MRLVVNTPAHLLFGAAAFSKKAYRRTLAAAFSGALLPDLSLYVMAGMSLFVLSIPPAVVFDQLYFSPLWQTVFAIDNSFLLWGAGLVWATWAGRELWQVFALSGLLHIFLDFLLHHDDGRSHFWPMTRWVFESPVSYWDINHHAAFVAPASALISAVLAAVLIQRFRDWRMWLVFLVLASMEIWVARQWLMFF